MVPLPKILLPYVSLFRVSVPASLQAIRAAGFDGVEILLTPAVRNHVDRFRAETKALGLTLHFHQLWSGAEGRIHWYNRVLARLGVLPDDTYTLSEHIPAGTEPVVIYANRYTEAEGHPNWWCQTVSVQNRRGGLELPYHHFLFRVERLKLPVVFDVQHYLEYALGLTGVAGLPQNQRILLEHLVYGWQKLGPFVREIHLADFDPKRGNTNGRNLPLGEGILPLKDFCNVVKESGWDGVVTPEVSPIHLCYRRRRLGELHKQVVKLFSN